MLREFDKQIKILKALNKTKEVKGVYDQVKSVKWYAEKIEKQRQAESKDIKFFENKHLEKALKDIRKSKKQAERALSQAVSWPKSKATQSFQAYRVIVQLVDRHGVSSKRVASAWLDWTRSLVNFNVETNAIIKKLNVETKAAKIRIRQLEDLVSYVDNLGKVFRGLASAPIPVPTQQLDFANNYLYCKEIRKELKKLKSVYEKIVKFNGTQIAEGRQRLKSNEAWIKWAAAGPPGSPEKIKRKASARRP